MGIPNDTMINGIRQFVKLSDVSKRDKAWDVHKHQNDKVKELYEQSDEFKNYGSRMRACSGFLMFNERIDTETGEVNYKLKYAQFCRVRTCPVCQWRRSLMWKARFYAALPKLEADYPQCAFMFLTLTVKNCEITELRETLDLMHTSFRKMMRYDAVGKVFKGWIRTTEVTRSADGKAHPHYHVLVMVNKSYFKSRDYIKHEMWRDLWKKACKLDYDPVVDIRGLKNRNNGTVDNKMSGVIAETLKYAVKPSDLITDMNWLFEYTRQVRKLRFVDTGGTLKNVFKVNDGDETNEDFIHLDEDKQQYMEADSHDKFVWHERLACYIKCG